MDKLHLIRNRLLLVDRHAIGAVDDFLLEVLDLFDNACRQGFFKGMIRSQPGTAFGHHGPLAQIEAGADLIYAERFGVFEAAKEKGVLAFGNMSDQNALAPNVVITGPVWDMYPTIKFAIEMVKKKAWVAMDLGEWSMMAKGGARLAPFHSFEKTLPGAVIKEVQDLKQKILNGTFRVPVDEQKPVSD